MLDQPLAGHDEAEAEAVLREAIDAHRHELNSCSGGSADGCGVAADAQYWLTFARALQEVGLGARNGEACDMLREGITCVGNEFSEPP